MDWVGGLETQPLAETTGLQRINLHVPPPPPATFGGSKLHPSHLQIRTSQLLSPAVLCKDSLDSAEIKANNKKQNKPTAGHCLLQIHRLLSAASATPGWQAASHPPTPRCPLLLGWRKLPNTWAAFPVTRRSSETPPQGNGSHTGHPASLSGPRLGMQSARCWILCARGVSVGTQGCDAENRCREALPHALATHHICSDPPAGTWCTPPIVSRVYGASHRRFNTLGTLMIPSLQMRNDTQRS